ncbi:MAG: protein affecting phage T7 exclusion by the F plasmid [halophilic archaeon J07HB67]|jgi:Protein affecting phage T7 exclusion by the F plasmid|nr:MAG: protein affecting phage T7 exclusion by the F plasmid [halophilic archaeon J07HB67]
MVRTRYVIAGLLGIPLVDATFLVFVAGAIGGIETVLLVVLTGLVGMLLVRAEGRHTLRKLQRTVAGGEAPTDELLDGAFLIAAGAFLLTPGLVTDTLGFLFALSPSRVVLRELLSRYVVTPYLDERTDGFVSGNVYVGGFPGGDGDAGTRTVFGDDDGFGGRGGEEDDDTVDIGEDEYSVE